MSAKSQPNDTSSPLSAWTQRVTEIPERGLEASYLASAEQRAEVSKALGLLGCEKLAVKYRIQAISGGRYRLIGNFTAIVSQACVITLAPVVSEIAETFDEEFWPPELVPMPKGGVADEQEVFAAGAAPEVIHQGHIEVGRIVFEQLATALDPYPRAEGATFAGSNAGVKRDLADNPFAALQRLKDKP